MCQLFRLVQRDPQQRARCSPSGARVQTASQENTARLRDAATGAELAVLRGHEKGVQSAVFDPSGTRVLTASQDNTSRIWRVFPTVTALDEHAHVIICQGVIEGELLVV
jgi:WD40 repeat protein